VWRLQRRHIFLKVVFELSTTKTYICNTYEKPEALATQPIATASTTKKATANGTTKKAWKILREPTHYCHSTQYCPIGQGSSRLLRDKLGGCR